MMPPDPAVSKFVFDCQTANPPLAPRRKLDDAIIQFGDFASPLAFSTPPIDWREFELSSLEFILHAFGELPD
jgi:hypothetical protein